MLGWASQPELDLVLSAEWPFEWCERWLVCGYIGAVASPEAPMTRGDS